MFLDTLFYAVVDIGKVIEGLYPALVARITIPHPPSAQPIFRLGRLHQSLLTQMSHHPGTRPFITRVMDNMVPMGCKTFKNFLVFK